MGEIEGAAGLGTARATRRLYRVVAALGLLCACSSHRAATAAGSKPASHSKPSGSAASPLDAQVAGTQDASSVSAGVNDGAIDASPGDTAFDAFMEPRTDAHMDAISDASSSDAGARPSRLVVDFTTHTTAGKFAPTNTGVVWVEDASGHWIFTLELWGRSFVQVLQRYFSSGGPDFGIPVFLGGPMPPPDTITGATLHEHKAHHEVWDLRDAQGVEVPDGTYTLGIEYSEGGQGPFYLIPFPKKEGETGVVLPPDIAAFTGVRLSLE